MDSRSIGAGAAIVGVFGVIVQYVPGFILGRWTDRGFEGLLPMLGSSGQTVTAYSYLIDIFTGIVLMGVAIALGYYIARGTDVISEYRRVVRAIAAGSTIGIALVWVPFVVWLIGSGSGSIDGFSIFMLVAVLIRSLVEVALPITVGAIAGAAITHFRARDPDPARGGGASTDLPADSPSTTRNDDGPINSRTAR